MLKNLDPSLQGLAKDLANPQVMALDPDLRNRVLFDHSLRADGLSAVLVLDAQWQRMFDSGSSRGCTRAYSLANRFNRG